MKNNNKLFIIVAVVVIFVISLVFIIISVNLNSTISYKNDGIIIEYIVRPNGSSIEEFENYKYIRVYSDKKISSGKKNTGDDISKSLSDSQFKKIVSIAFSKKFKSLDKDLSDHNVMDGSSQNLIVYYEDGSSFSTGGLNPNNSLYNKLIKTLYESVE